MRKIIVLFWGLYTYPLLAMVAQPKPEFIEEFKGSKIQHVYSSNPEIVIEVAQGTRKTNLETTTDTNDSEETIPKHHHHKRMLVSNGATAVVTALITAGVTLTVHFTNCKS